MPGVIVALIVVMAIVNLILFFVFISFFGLWIQCKTTGVRIGFFDLVFMKFRKVHVALIVKNAIKAHVKQVNVSHRDLEAHYLAGGNVTKVVDALIKAKALGIEVSFEIAARTDLAGYDLDEIDPEKFRTIAEQGDNL